MAVDRVKFQDIVSSQLPRYVREDFPLLEEFLRQYYVSQEFESGVLDLVQNLDQYVKVDQLTNLKNSTILNIDISYTTRSIPTSSDENFTEGFPDRDGLLKIDDEIIYYEYKTDSTFENCSRGFSGITSYESNTPDQLTFVETEADKHSSGAVIYNLNVLFLQEFFKKLKKQVTPGYDGRTLFEGLDEKNFIFGADTFYKSKGTDTSFKILFRALYGEQVDIIRPSEFLFRPSDADYRVTQEFVVEQVQGDVYDLQTRTLFQDSTNSRGTVTNVEKIRYDGAELYQISIDTGYQRDIDVNGTIFGEFRPNPKTQLLNSVSAGSTILDVDSTIGFPESGSIVTFDIDNNPISLPYESKNSTQFIGVSDLLDNISATTDIRLDDYSYARLNNGDEIQVRMTATLQEFQLQDSTYFFNPNDTIRIQSIGLESSDERSKNWKFNVKTRWQVSNIVLVDSSERSYLVTTYDDQFFNPGYFVTLIDQIGTVFTGSVSRVVSSNTFVVRLNALVDVGRSFVINNEILKGNSDRYTQLNSYFANVQNTYSKFDGSALVASNSIANYPTLPTNPYDKKIIFSGSAEDLYVLRLTNGTDHGFFTGDAVYYKPNEIVTTQKTPDGIELDSITISGFDDVSESVYYVQRVDSERIKIAKSRSDLFDGEFVSLIGTVIDNQFIYFDFYQKSLEPQGIYREIVDPVNKSGEYLTEPGYTGILINGVEILNYKSTDAVYFGDIQSIEITNQGSGYDVINPPSLVINDVVGTGATGTCSVNGSLDKINIIDPGFDYVDVPTVDIRGGNGYGAIAECNTSVVRHTLQFNAEIGGNVNIVSNTIGFSTFHKFASGEKVTYNPNKSQVILGVSTDSFYYAGLVDDSTITLHKKEEDAISGINTVNFASYGKGVQNITAARNKRIVTSVEVTNPGSGYQNKERKVTPVGVNTALNQINIKNHGYSEREIILYSKPVEGVVGLSTNEKYYVRKIDDDNFSLSLVGTGNSSADFYYNNNILVDLHSSGDGFFNYEPIIVTVNGVIGVTTFAGQDFNCKVQPLFRGEIETVDLTSSGVAYGSSEILNFNRQPNITFESGSGAILSPVIDNGRVVDVVINAGGRGYNSPPNLRITGNGSYCRLTPIVNDGQVVEIKIINSGLGYSQSNTRIEVISAGSGARAEAQIHSWTVNLFARNFNNIDSDDGFIDESLDNSSLEYCHLYAPRVLRQNTYALGGSREDNTLYGVPDLVFVDGSEVDSNFHSPILGWSYDGNPIYGPFGFSDIDGGTIKQMKSGYELILRDSNRPNPTQWPAGFFVEDYIFTERGDLDEFNGRFCVTPDYPEGVYAYFTTLNTTVVDSGGPFAGFKRPAFPYFIGNKYQSQPNNFNFRISSNQIDYDIESNEWFRNTSPYHTNDSLSGYDYILNSNKIQEQTIDITASSLGTVQSVGILTGGKDYKVGDRVIFNNEGTSGIRADARVSRVLGKTVKTVSTASTVFFNVELAPDINNPTQFIGFTSAPHGFEDFDIVNISGLSSYVSGIPGSYSVGVRSDNFVLTLGVGTPGVTGLTTYFYISGALEYPFIRENDILGISSEKVKVLNIDRLTGRIRVEREYDGTVGSSYTNRDVLFEDPRKFRFTPGVLGTSRNYYVNRDIYFDPAESVGVGTTLGPGVGNTITFSDPGVGKTQVFIKPQSIYIKGHGLQLNDVLYYFTNGGDSIESWNGTSNPYVDLTAFDKFYAAPLTTDTIGIATNKVGLGTTGGYVGVNSNPGLLYFTDAGTGLSHYFKTERDNVLKSQADKNIVTVSTASTHNLSKGETVRMSVKPSTDQTITVKYNDFNRRIVFDPIDFVSGDVDTQLNTVTIADHDFILGDKVIYTATTPIGGLENEKMYYVFPYSGEKIRLVSEKYQIYSKNPDFIDFSSASAGTFSKINPIVTPKLGQNLIFDLSDSSLSFIQNGVVYSAFYLQLFTDSDFTNLFLTSKEGTDFEVTTTGRPGIDSNAQLKLFISDETPKYLHYKFQLDNIDIIPTVKSEIVIDEDTNSFNQIDIIESAYNGEHTIVGLGTTTFQFNIEQIPESLTYNQSDSKTTYSTKSRNVTGTIDTIDINNPGSGYRVLPGITTISTQTGSGAIVNAQSTNIGVVLETRKRNIGFDYPTDKTLKIVANLPEILKIESLASFERIGISSQGQNYLVSPDLIIKDGFTGEIVRDLDIFYHLGDESVTILQNTTGLYDVTPEIIPIHNSNGVGISSIVYTESSKVVRLYLDATFSESEDFPYNPGSKIIVEGVSVGLGSTGKGYNSENYNYDLFEVTNADSQLGGAGAWVEYSLNEYLAVGEVPGSANITESFAKVVSELDFPIFDPVLKINNFLIGEKVISDGKTGFVESWSPNIEQLKITTPREFTAGNVVKGLSSGTQGVIETKYNFNSQITIGSGTTFFAGWQDEVGFLNDNLQKIPNNEYYQNFSYSLKSRVPFDTWNDPVSSMNHTSGFAKFADLMVEGTQIGDAVPVSVDSDIEIVNDIIGEVDLNCYPDFDNVTEQTVIVDNVIISKTITFKNRIITDFFESVGNRVLDIDDFSETFNSNPRATRYSSVAGYGNNYTYNKILTYVQDRTYTNERQFSINSLIQFDNLSYINEYATLATRADLGYFDTIVTASGWELTFFPVRFEFDNYNITTLNLGILNDVASDGDKDFGTVAEIRGDHTSVSAGTTTTIATIPLSYRSTKLNIQLEDTSENLIMNEISLVHDYSDVYRLDFGEIANSGVGFGTYNTYIDGSNIKVDFIPSGNIAIDADVSIVSISTAGTGVSSESLSAARVSSHYVSIAADASPVANVVATYTEPFKTAYYLVSVEDTTNNQYQLSEVAVVNSLAEEAFVEWAPVETGGSIGTVGVTSTSGDINLTFTPNANVDVEVRVLAYEMMIYDDNTNPEEIEIGSTIIESDFGSYRGTALDVQQSFGLKHNNLEIFRRSFDGSDEEVVNLTNNVVNIPDHYFVTGEKIIYRFGPDSAIGIETSNVVGIGTTDKLPSDLYVVKVDSGNLRFAESAEKALQASPEVFTLTSVGIGTSHSLTSTNANARTLIALDNMLQSPISDTVVTSNLSADIAFDSTIPLTGVTSFFAGDLIRIADEIMTVQEVGVGGANNLIVQRETLGTGIVNHSSGSQVVKLSGNYNIVDNTLFFSEAPFGQVPLSTTTGDPDYRDWTGITTHSTFQGRTFMRSGIPGSSDSTYGRNFVFDDISSQFTGVQSSFTLTSEAADITGFSTDNAIILINNIFQEPQGVQAEDANYDLEESAGITSITFSGSDSNLSYDPNATQLPRGGIIVSVGSEEGFGYQPLVAAGGTAVVSGLGTISSISIGNSGSGYRSGIQTVVNVGVQTFSNGIPNIEFIGTAAISGGHIVSVAITNPGTGYTTTDVPQVVFDEPLSYSNIPLIYSNSSAIGSGLSATANIVVGQGSSVIDFELIYNGYGYGNGEILTVAVGGDVGIPTNTNLTFEEFQITVDRTNSDKFAGFNIGELQVFDKLDSQFNGSQTAFRLTINGAPFAIRSAAGSNVEVDKTLLVFINNVLQQPESAYTFTGGSVIELSQPPNPGDTSKILFYKGSGDLDVVLNDILETVKVGDILDIDNNPEKGQSIALDQDPRTVTGITTIDSVTTNPYVGPGITTDETIVRPVTWCKQSIDKIINGQKIGKDRVDYEPSIYPASFLIQPVGVGSTVLYVDNLRPLFDSENEQQVKDFQDIITIVSQDSRVGAVATAVVSGLGTISSVILSDGGSGYSVIPDVTISTPPGLGTDSRASVTAALSGDKVASINVTNPGSGYTSTNPPVVLVGPPPMTREKTNISSYSGDYGVIVGFGTTTISSQDQLILDFFIPVDSFMRDDNLVGSGITVSGISTGDFFTLFNTNMDVGEGTVISEKTDGTQIAITTSFCDSVFQVSDTYVTQVEVLGIGQTTVRRVFSNLTSISTVSFSESSITFDSNTFTFDSNTFVVYSGGISSEANFGSFSWGKIELSGRTNPESFNFYGDNGYSGISTSALVSRFNPLKFTDYII